MALVVLLESRVLLASMVTMDPPALRDSLAPQAEVDHWEKTDLLDLPDPPEHRYETALELKGLLIYAACGTIIIIVSVSDDTRLQLYFDPIDQVKRILVFRSIYLSSCGALTELLWSYFLPAVAHTTTSL